MCDNDCWGELRAGCDGSVVDRRGFLTRAGAAVVAAMLTACGDGQIGGVAGPGALGGAVDLVIDPAQFPALASVGGIARVDAPGSGSAPVAVVRSGPSSWMAFSMSCPHQGTTVNIATGGFTCPNHGARFDAAGANTGGQATGPLHAFTVVQRADGMLVISGVGPAGSGGGGDDEDDDDDP